MALQLFQKKANKSKNNRLFIKNICAEFKKLV